MSNTILDFEAQCTSPDCPGCGKNLEQLQYTAKAGSGPS